jgi:hypothetical protein
MSPRSCCQNVASSLINWRDLTMRGRKPNRFRIRPSDESELLQIARSPSLPWFQVQRARIVLARAAGSGTGAGADQFGSQRRRALCCSFEAFPQAPPPAQGYLFGSRWRFEPHRPGNQELLRRMSRLVASGLDAGPCVLARSSGAAQSCIRSPLFETRIVGKSRGLY